MDYTFEVFRDRTQRYRFRFVSPDGEVLFLCPGHKEKAAVLAAIERIMENSGRAVVADETT